MRFAYVLKHTFNACFTYGKRTLHILLCTYIDGCRFLWRQRSSASYRDQFVRRPSLRPSVTLSIACAACIPWNTGLKFMYDNMIIALWRHKGHGAGRRIHGTQHKRVRAQRAKKTTCITSQWTAKTAFTWETLGSENKWQNVTINFKFIFLKKACGRNVEELINTIYVWSKIEVPRDVRNSKGP